MIVCEKCGTHNDDDDAFCGSCGAFLEWEGRKVSVEPKPEPALVGAEEAQEDQRGLIERVVDRFSHPGEGAVLDAETRTSEPGQPHSVATPQDEEPGSTATLAAEAEERARLAAEAAERSREAAEERARREAEAAEAARQEADEAEQARAQAQGAAAAEAAEAHRLRVELETAEASRAAAQAELERERAALEQLRTEADVARGKAAEEASAEAQRQAEEAELARRQAQERLAAERRAVEQARADAQAAEAARQEAEARAAAESKAAAAAARQATEAEQARLVAEAKAAEQAEAARRARRAAALVAKPKPRPTQPAGEAVPTTEPTPPTHDPKPVKPTEVKARPVTPLKPTQPSSRKIRPGQLVCGNCGEANDPERNFCRRCGQSLKDAEVARPPWWRRLPFRRRKRYAAGQRRGRRGKGGGGAVAKGREAKRKVSRVVATVARVAAVLAVLGIGGLSVGPWRPMVMEWAGDRLASIRQVIAPEFDPVRATGAEASSEHPEHPGANLIDGVSTSWWAGAGPASGAEPSILLTFAQPVDIAYVGITSGASDVREFAAFDRPAKLHLLFDNGFETEVDVADRHEFQRFKIDDSQAAGVSTVLVRIVETHAGLPEVAITEIEFRSKRGASPDG